MQRIGINGRRIIFGIVLPIILLALLIFIDQFTKNCFKKIYFEKGEINIIGRFLHTSYAENSGAAYGVFSNKDWGQLFFKILTAIALLIFTFIFIYSINIKSIFLSYSIVCVIAGTVGNFIDRVTQNKVFDFICIELNNFTPFGVFNIADILICLGVILLIVYILFIDKKALFKKKNNG